MNGTAALGIGDTVSKTDIMASNLTYDPASNANNSNLMA